MSISSCCFWGDKLCCAWILLSCTQITVLRQVAEAGWFWSTNLLGRGMGICQSQYSFSKCYGYMCHRITPYSLCCHFLKSTYEYTLAPHIMGSCIGAFHAGTVRPCGAFVQLWLPWACKMCVITGMIALGQFWNTHVPTCSDHACWGHVYTCIHSKVLTTFAHRQSHIHPTETQDPIHKILSHKITWAIYSGTFSIWIKPQHNFKPTAWVPCFSLISRRVIALCRGTIAAMQLILG